jgi:hypothetical protein
MIDLSSGYSFVVVGFRKLKIFINHEPPPKPIQLLQRPGGGESLEDNLSRAFALCLLHDPLFLDRVLSEVLNAEDHQAIAREQWAHRNIDIDVQLAASSFDGYRKLYAVGASPREMDLSLIECYPVTGSSDPITDVSVALGDILIVFEFKVSKVDPGQQLKGQVEAITQFNTAETLEVIYEDFSWGEIIAVAESALGFLGKLENGNVLTRDFVSLLESRYADWFPPRPMSQIPAPKSPQSPEAERINKRLDLIKGKLGETADFEYQIYTGTYKRSTLNVDWGWTREVLLDYDFRAGQPWIRLSIYAGDTKRQGWSLFGLDTSFGELSCPIPGAEFKTLPFLKFRHFNSAIASLFLDWEVAQHTHTLEFHTVNTGRYPRGRWPEFEAKLDKIYPEWRNNCAYQEN